MSRTTGITSKEQSEVAAIVASNRFEEKYPIGIKTPLSLGSDNKDTLFSMNYEILDQIRDNLKNLILTRKGERLGYSDFGTNIHYLYSQDLNQDQISDFIMKEITAAVSKYMPSLQLQNFYSKEVKKEELQSLRLNSSVDVSNSSDGRDNNASNFYNSLGNVEIGRSSITKNDSKEIIYKISVEYKLPESLTKIPQSLTIFLRKSV